jgi:hypothetical protein
MASRPSILALAESALHAATGAAGGLARATLGLAFDVAAPVVREVSTQLIDRLDLDPLARRIAEVDVAPVAARVADAVDVDALAQQVVDSVDLDPIIAKLRGELGPIVQQVLEELELGILAERVLDELDLPTLVTGTIQELRMGSVVRAAMRRPPSDPELNR